MLSVMELYLQPQLQRQPSVERAASPSARLVEDGSGGSGPEGGPSRSRSRSQDPAHHADHGDTSEGEPDTEQGALRMGRRLRPRQRLQPYVLPSAVGRKRPRAAESVDGSRGGAGAPVSGQLAHVTGPGARGAGGVSASDAGGASSDEGGAAGADDAEEEEEEADTVELLAAQLHERFRYFDALDTDDSVWSARWSKSVLYPGPLYCQCGDLSLEDSLGADPNMDYETEYIMDEMELVKGGPGGPGREQLLIAAAQPHHLRPATSRDVTSGGDAPGAGQQSGGGAGEDGKQPPARPKSGKRRGAAARRERWYLVKFQGWCLNPRFEEDSEHPNAHGDWLPERNLRHNTILALWRRYRPQWWLQQHPACSVPAYRPAGGGARRTPRHASQPRDDDGGLGGLKQENNHHHHHQRQRRQQQKREEDEEEDGEGKEEEEEEDQRRDTVQQRPQQGVEPSPQAGHAGPTKQAAGAGAGGGGGPADTAAVTALVGELLALAQQEQQQPEPEHRWTASQPPPAPHEQQDQGQGRQEQGHSQAGPSAPTPGAVPAYPVPAGGMQATQRPVEPAPVAAVQHAMPPLQQLALAGSPVVTR